MKTYFTSRLIDDLEQQTETILQKAISEWQMIAPSKLLHQPAEGKWSGTQCLSHLNSYGNYYLPFIQSSINSAIKKGTDPKQMYTPGWLGEYFVNLMKPDTYGKKIRKMSAHKNHQPGHILDGDKVLSQFIDQQERTLILLGNARMVNLENAKVPISIAPFIKLRLGDTFRFLIMHNYRHVLQADKAINNSGNKVSVHVNNL